MIDAELVGNDTAVAGALRATGAGCCGKLARQLIASGTDPGARIHFRRGDMVCLTGTVAAFASRSWAGEATDPGMTKWRPDQRREMPHSLRAWAVKNGFLKVGVDA